MGIVWKGGEGYFSGSTLRYSGGWFGASKRVREEGFKAFKFFMLLLRSRLAVECYLSTM